MTNPTGQLTFDGQVRGLSSEGLGIVNHPDGRVFFVAGTWPGDEGSFTITRVEKRYGYAEIASVTKTSADRVEVPCVYQGYGPSHCGGCPWMIGSYESQLQHKEHRVRHALDRAKLINEKTDFKTIRGSEKFFAYRNRAQFKSDGARLGFVADSSHEIIDIKECLVLNEKMQSNLSGLRATLPNSAWKPVGQYQWNFLDADDDVEAQGIELNRRRPFKQGNVAQNEYMRSWLRDQVAPLKRDGRVLELFCGSGNFTSIFVDLKFKEIVAIEVAKDALEKLDAKGWPTVKTFALDLAHPKFMEGLATRNKSTKYLFLDPPREGAKGVEKLAAGLGSLEKIFYVSCNTATFVRDASALASLGFHLSEVQAVDLFPHTSHVEVLSVLTKN